MSFIDRFGRSAVGKFAGALVVLALVAGVVRALTAGRLHYTNYWGGYIFAPFVLAIVAIIIFGLVRSYVRGDPPPKSLRGRAARKARQAENTVFPIDDYKKW